MFFGSAYFNPGYFAIGYFVAVQTRVGATPKAGTSAILPTPKAGYALNTPVPKAGGGTDRNQRPLPGN